MHDSIHVEAVTSRTTAWSVAHVVFGMLAIMLLSSSASAFAVCEQEVARLCSSGSPRCIEDATKTIAQASSDCKTPEGRKDKGPMWQSTPDFFDGQPIEKVFWRCVARICDGIQ